MTPRILKNNATDFSRMGYGALNTTISCKVTEELNQAPTLEMSLLVTDPLLQFVTVGNIIAAQPNKNDNIQAFIIEEITKPINGVITIYAPHIAQHRTKLIPFSPITRRVNLDNTLQVLSGPAIENNNPFDFVRAADKNNVTADFSTDEPHSLRELMGGMEGSVLDIYGGEWSYDNFTITLHNHRGRDNGARVLYGRNMTDYTLDEYFDYNKSITGAVGFAWYTNENDVECIAISDPQYSALVDNYPYKKTVTVDFTDYYQGSILISQSEINRHTAAWIRNRGAIASTVDISYNQIDNIGGEDIGMGDTLHIFNSVYNYETESRVVGLVFDVLAEEYETVTIGEQKTTLNEAIEGAAGSSTTIISGGGGSGVEPSTTTPLMDGTATAGTETRYARGDHRHPTDTSRLGVNDTAANSYYLQDATNNNAKIQARYFGSGLSSAPEWLPMYQNMGDNIIELSPVHLSTLASAIIEYGSNSNGHYLKYSNGTLICWQTVTVNRAVNTAWGSLYESAAIQWGYPHAFVSNPVFTASRYRGTACFIEYAGNGSYTTSPNVHLVRPNTAAAADSVFGFMAIGKWK